MNCKIVFIAIAVIIFSLVLPLRTKSVNKDDIDQIVSKINRNFNALDARINVRKQTLSPVFIDAVETNKNIFNELKLKAELTDKNNVADIQKLTGQLRKIESVTDLWLSFLSTAAKEDNGMRKIRFDTQFNYKSNCGWKVCWDSAGRDGIYPPAHCYNPTSTTLPASVKNPEEVIIGEFVATFNDPNKPDEKYKQDFSTGDIGIDEVDIIPLNVPYKIKVDNCPKKTK